MKQERIAPVRPKREPNSEVAEDVVIEDADGALLDDVDELLDEIDAVLEEQSVLVNFRQRSGQ